jgi:hypothetical protein
MRKKIPFIETIYNQHVLSWNTTLRFKQLPRGTSARGAPTFRFEKSFFERGNYGGEPVPRRIQKSTFRNIE